MHLSQWLRRFSLRWLLRGRNSRRRAGRVPARARRRVWPCLEVLESRVVPSTFMVTNTADSGPGTLRQAILDANANPGKDTIKFDFSSPNLPRVYPPGVLVIDVGGGQSVKPTFDNGVVVIEPTSGMLPAITDAVVIDGSVSGFGLTGPVPGVEIRGDVVGKGNSGLRLDNADDSEIYGLIINSYERGIHLVHSDNVAIEDCYLGVTFDGTNATSNKIGLQLDTGSGNNYIRDCTIVNSLGYGVLLQDEYTTGNIFAGNLIADNNFGIEFHNAANNTLGDTAPTLGNQIVKNTVGVSIKRAFDLSTGAPESNLIINNRISYNDKIGVYISGGVSNQIGGSSAGAANVITANDEGVVVEGFQAKGNLIQGNYIGILPDGTATDSQGKPTGNLMAGVRITDAPNNTVDKNTISGNNPGGANFVYFYDDAYQGQYVVSAIVVELPQATGNVISNNLIGTDPTGSKAVSNYGNGIFLSAASQNTVRGNVVAATQPFSLGAGGNGIYISDSGSGVTSHNLIEANFIGTDITGTKALGNASLGIFVVSIDDSKGNSINAVSDNEIVGNVISGNGDAGVGIDGKHASGNTLAGNFIGTNATGAAALPNQGDGVLVDIAPDTVIGLDPAARNLISGNAGDGIRITGAATGTVVQGNYIGLDRNGSKAIGNGGAGVEVLDAPGNKIGRDEGYGNVISGNKGAGIVVQGKQATGNILQGNIIGTDSGGGIALPNSGDGIRIAAPNNTIGGTTSFAGNIVAGNLGDGIHFASDAENGITASGNVVQGNDLGGATFSVPNGGYGISLYEAPSNKIGGTAIGAGNDIHDNAQGDVLLAGAGTTGNTLLGNTIGRAQNNPDPFYAVDIDSAPNNTIGGTTAGAGNTIRYHSNGISIRSAAGTTIQGNTVSDNHSDGISVDGASGTIIGGSRAGGASNSISGNAYGVVLVGSATQNTQIQGNDLTGNQHVGILVTQGPSNNQIGGDSNDLANTIRGTFDGAGIGISISKSSGNAILVNSISDNGGLGIDLGGDGVTPNDPGDADSGANGLLNYPMLLSAAVVNGATTIRGYINTTPSTSVTLRFFGSPNPDASGYGEGQDYLGKQTVTTDAGGNATFTATFSTALSPGTIISATASAADPAGGTDTSEFSNDVRVPADEFQVNTTSAGNQYVGNVGTDANGNFVVVWSGNGPQGAGVYYRRFDVSGTPLDPAEQRANVTDGLVIGPVVTVNPDGSFVIGWGFQPPNGSGSDIYARRFAADGTSLDAKEFRVSTTSLQVLDSPSIASDSKGNFVLTWETGNPFGQGTGYDISARRYHADGTPIDASEFRVNQNLNGDQQFPSVAMAPNGEFVVGWLENSGASGTPYRVVARRFSISTSSNEFTLNSSSTPDYHYGPSLALAGDGQLLAAWTTGIGSGIYFRRFDAANQPLDSQEVVATSQSGARPSVGYRSDDSFVIAWQTENSSTVDTDILYRSYSANGTPLTSATTANEHLAGTQQRPALSVAPNDTNFVIVWDSINQDGAGDGVFARRFAAVNNQPIAYPLFGETALGKPIQLTLSGDSGDAGMTQQLTFALATNPSHGTLSNFNAATGTVTYTPAAGYSGPDSFTVTVTDDNSLGAPARTSSPATVGIIVVPPPIITGVSSDTGVSTSDGITSANPITISGTALPQTQVTVSQAGVGALGTARADADGQWSYTLSTPLADGSYKFTADVRDSSGNVLVASAAYSVRVDTTPPISSVKPLPTSTSVPAFLVSWSGTDAGSGIASYDVFVSDNGSSFVPFKTATTMTSATFTGQYGHRYGFYSIATDIAGNRQTTPTAAQATIFVAPPPPPPAPTPSKAVPVLHTPPLLALFEGFLNKTVMAGTNGTETVIDSFLGFQLFISTYDNSGYLQSVTFFGINVTFLFA